jgi:hypothetical protein
MLLRSIFALLVPGIGSLLLQLEFCVVSQVICVGKSGCKVARLQGCKALVRSLAELSFPLFWIGGVKWLVSGNKSSVIQPNRSVLPVIGANSGNDVSVTAVNGTGFQE